MVSVKRCTTIDKVPVRHVSGKNAVDFYDVIYSQRVCGVAPQVEHHWQQST